MEQLQHFSHQHMLILIHFPPDNNHENSDNEDEDKDEDEVKDDVVLKDCHVGKCKMCTEDIYSFHQCYYYCKECDYSLHKFCAQLPIIQQNHPLHPNHELTLSRGCQLREPNIKFKAAFGSQWMCDICTTIRSNFYNYHCYICKFTMDIICATMSEQIMNHPSHPHQLQRYFCSMTSSCDACTEKQSGTFYHCTICSWFQLNLNCALLPSKLNIQHSTDGSFSHSHLLTLAYLFPYTEKRAKFFPTCRICDRGFDQYKWHYRCNKCQYYVHIECATSIGEAFMSSVLLPAGLGKTFKNFNDDDYPNLICCPFPDESSNLLKHKFFNKDEFITKGKNADGVLFKHSSHQHMLILFNTQASLVNKSISLHDPMKKVQLLCDGCVRPVVDVPFYKCHEHYCGFILHEWCNKLPCEIKDHHDHPEHKLFLLSKVPTDMFDVFKCKICGYPSNGFAYGCIECHYYVDINCGFIPNVITHEAHPNHLLFRIKASADLSETKYCAACQISMENNLGFHCPTCDFYVHSECALLLPRTIRHKYDKHPLSLRYYPVENHSSEYFCEICESEFDPTKWFYHCSTCAYSMHTACAPLILQSEVSTYSECSASLFNFLNVKFGGRYKFESHEHCLTFAQGINDDGACIVCHEPLQYGIIFKCFECKFVLHIWCAEKLSLNPAIHNAKILQTSLLHLSLLE